MCACEVSQHRDSSDSETAAVAQRHKCVSWCCVELEPVARGRNELSRMRMCQGFDVSMSQDVLRGYVLRSGVRLVRSCVHHPTLRGPSSIISPRAHSSRLRGPLRALLASSPGGCAPRVAAWGATNQATTSVRRPTHQHITPCWGAAHICVQPRPPVLAAGPISTGTTFVARLQRDDPSSARVR